MKIKVKKPIRVEYYPKTEEIIDSLETMEENQDIEVHENIEKDENEKINEEIEEEIEEIEEEQEEEIEEKIEKLLPLILEEENKTLI